VSVSGPLAPVLTINPAPSGTGPATISFSAPAVGPTPRTALVTFNNPVGAVEIPVVQEIPDFLTVTPQNPPEFSAGIGFPETINVDGNVTFYKNNTLPWITLTPSNGQNAPSSFTVEASENDGGSRSGFFDVTGGGFTYQVNVSQAAYVAPEPPPPPEPEPVTESISVSSITTSIPFSGGTTSLRLLSTSPTSLFWSATKSGPGAPAFSINPSPDGNGPTNVSVSGGSNNTGAPRYVDITFTSLTSPATDSFRVTQLAAPIPEPVPDEFSIPSTSTTIPGNGEAGTSTPRSLITSPNSITWFTSKSGPAGPAFSINPAPSGTGPASITVSAGQNTTGAPRSTTVSFTSPAGEGSFFVSQPALPVPDTLNITPTELNFPYVVGLPKTITASGTGTATFTKLNSNPTNLEFDGPNPSPVNTPFDINVLNPNPSPSPITVGSIDISHPTPYTITVTQDGAPAPPPPEPSSCFSIRVKVANAALGFTEFDACNNLRVVTHYFDAQFINSANTYFGTSTSCAVGRSGNWYVADENGAWARFLNGVFQEAGFCGGGFGGV